MRFRTTGERTLLREPHVNYHLRVLVENGDGVMVVLTDTSSAVLSAGGINWVDEWTVEANADAKVMSATFSLHRENDDFSLAPLMGGSSLNRKADNSYSPLIYAGRLFQIITAVTYDQVAPVAGDWKEIIKGKIDKVNWQADPVTVECRDMGAFIQHAWIEEPVKYNEDNNVWIQDQLQTLLDDSGMLTIPTIVTPVDPVTEVGAYTQSETNTMDAIEAIAQQIGWDFRYKYDATGFAVPTFYEPDRAKTIADDEFYSTEYFEVSNLTVSDVDVRNVVRVYYVDKVDGKVKFVDEIDSASITKYKGRRFMKIGTDSTKLIKTSAAATRLALAAVTELADPFADQEIEGRYYWPVEIGDLYKWKANNIHYDSDQQYAVVALRHQGRAGNMTTNFITRGKPVAYWKKWWRLGTSGPLSDVPEISFVNTPIPLYDDDGFQKGWILTGAVDANCRQLQITIEPSLEISSVLPLGISMSVTEYRANTETIKGFTIELLQDAGEIGVITLTPRDEYSTNVDNTGIAGSPYIQTLQRSPVTLLVVEKVPQVTFRNLLFTVSPTSAQLHYRLKYGTNPFGDWNIPVTINGQFSTLIDLSQGDVLIEFYSVSVPGGVAEEVNRVNIDQDDNPEFQLDITEEPINIMNIVITPDDDIVKWAIWAKNGASPKDLITEEPDDVWLKFRGVVNQRHIAFRAENGIWQIVVRGYDINGYYREVVQTFEITGVIGTVGKLFSLSVTTRSISGLDYIELYWTHNAIIDAEDYEVLIIEGIQTVDLNRLARLDPDDTSTIPLYGGWRRGIQLALPTDPGAIFRKFSYEVWLTDASNGFIAIYRAEISLWVAGSGSTTTTDPNLPDESTIPSNVPPIPSVTNDVAAFTVYAFWAADDVRYRVRIQWQLSANNGATWSSFGNPILLAAGTTEYYKTGPKSGILVRTRIAYETAAGTGTFSAYSEAVRVLKPGELDY